MKKLIATISVFVSGVANSCEIYTDQFHLENSLSANHIAVVTTFEDPKNGKMEVVEVFRGSLVVGQKLQLDIKGIELEKETAYLIYSNSSSLEKLHCKSIALAEDEHGYDTTIVVEMAHRESS
uniref:hypothetical protein n=1 Tax=Microbulbifer agarilyticus TaxID=260552 RepID=UPI0002558E34|nr:hypothetical protein [Microbulbifer agarilyticus]